MSSSHNVVDMDLFRVRRGLEAKIAELIDLLDLIDIDCDLEDGFDEEPDPIEPNGDEHDYNGDEEDHSVGRLDGGSGL
ncbi:hypothetical protein GOC35_00580 [Sinorhizobium meliloti]|nr:hypothetical protein [Sinorhizobium meliloti]